jgi:hypothetical protein
MVLGVSTMCWHERSKQRARVRDQLRDMGIGRWSQCLEHFEHTFVFSGSSTCYYKLSIPPTDVDAFLITLGNRGWTRTTETFPATGPSHVREDRRWWRPADEADLQVMEMRVRSDGSPTGSFPLWYVAASKRSGRVYMYKVGW